jgi:hypothetical protein
VTTKLDEMWAALEAHEPDASYADAWQRMCKERTKVAAWAVCRAAPARSAAAAAAYMAARTAAEAAAARADRYAQEAIDALKREVKP